VRINTIKLFSKRRRLDDKISDAFDTFRWLSAFMVCLGHSIWIFYDSSLDRINPIGFIFDLLGRASVMMFFILSGFFICKSFSTSITEKRIDIGSYCKKRINRLYPPLIFSVLVSALIVILSPYLFVTDSRSFIDNGFLAEDSIDNTAEAFIGAIFFLNGLVTPTIHVNGALWSLPYEFWYYASICVIPFLYKKWVVVVSLALIGITAFFFKLLLMYSLVWYLGVLLALMHNHNHEISTKKIILLMLVSSFSSIFIAINYGLIFNEIEPIVSLSSLPVKPLFNISIGICIFAILHLILTNRIKSFSFKPELALFSYTNYVMHTPIMFLIYGTFQIHFIEMHKGLLFVFSIIAACAIFLFSQKIAFIEKIRIFKITRVR